MKPSRRARNSTLVEYSAAAADAAMIPPALKIIIIKLNMKKRYYLVRSWRLLQNSWDKISLKNWRRTGSSFGKSWHPWARIKLKRREREREVCKEAKKLKLPGHEPTCSSLTPPFSCQSMDSEVPATSGWRTWVLLRPAPTNKEYVTTSCTATNATNATTPIAMDASQRTKQPGFFKTKTIFL